MVFVTLAGVRGIPDFSIFTLIGIIICFLVIVFGVVRMIRSSGDPSEKQSGITTIFMGSLSVLFVTLLIEVPHQLFFS